MNAAREMWILQPMLTLLGGNTSQDLREIENDKGILPEDSESTAWASLFLS